jgi:hypothetical protein
MTCFLLVLRSDSDAVLHAHISLQHSKRRALLLLRTNRGVYGHQRIWHHLRPPPISRSRGIRVGPSSSKFYFGSVRASHCWVIISCTNIYSITIELFQCTFYTLTSEWFSNKEQGTATAYDFMHQLNDKGSRQFASVLG